MKKNILCVDDEPNILHGYKRQLHREFQIEIAEGGNEGLELIKEKGPFAVVVSDMRMPHMNGTEFLTKVRKCSPDTVRMLLTGQADMADTIAVVNEGQIFRFLAKPCPPEAFSKALQDAVAQHELITSERELLDKTLKGSIKLLVDILSVVSPAAFSRSNRLRQLAHNIAVRLHVANKDMWEVDFAALLAHIGCVTLPDEILEKKYSGQQLSEAEKSMFAKHPQVGRDLLINIPRLQGIAAAVAYQEKHFDGQGIPDDVVKGIDIPLIARILKVVHDYDELLSTGKTSEEAREKMAKWGYRYDQKILAALEAEMLEVSTGFIIKAIRAEEIELGMVLADDISG